MNSHYDLAIIGSGSGNSIADDRFTDRKVALLEKGVFGGTCLNVGCIPTKMFVYPADLALNALHGEHLGVESHLDQVRWPEIRDRIFGRIDPISAGGRRWRDESNEHVTLFEGHARFVAERTIDTGTGETITADEVVVATGSRPLMPRIDGLDSVTVHTSDTVMRLDTLPERILIVGGGFVAAEFAHVFGAFGSQVTLANRSSALLRAEDDEISAAFTRAAQDRWDVRLDTEVSRLEPLDGATRAHLTDGTTLDVDVVLVATGRVPNSDLLDLHLAGIEVDGTGLVKVDEHLRTTAEGVWALGDVANDWQLKHVANHEARVVQHNLLHPGDLRTVRQDAVPSAVFSNPQVASVGLTEREATRRGIAHVVARQQYAGTAYGWAMEDTSSFAKVLADPVNGQILGAHLMGPQASNLIQPLIQAMSFGQTAHDGARGQYWIHPALAEVVENVLLALPDPTHAGE
ncbi:mycothione reductase [Nocardioides sp.]|uniref:mycothione reductase n=1 Tax=Nocardioides sp. TaxID=35761 RepID=UPI002B27A13F|nr:mycothione reductase [Nocardioides sp.]